MLESAVISTRSRRRPSCLPISLFTSSQEHLCHTLPISGKEISSTSRRLSRLEIVPEHSCASTPGQRRSTPPRRPILIPIDPFNTLSHLKAYQIWSFTDLNLVSFSAKDATVVTRATEKTACIPLKPPEKLEELKQQYKLKRRTLDAHVAKLLSCL